MSGKYKVGEDAILHFVTFSVMGWIDVFSREQYTGGPVHGAITSGQLTSSGVVPNSVISYLSTQPAPGSTKPKAYLNWVLLDEQFNFVQAGSQIIPANETGTAQQIIKIGTDAAVAQKNGYVYIYVSNESNNLVYFDNLQITHIRGPILEETHYYPFGLTMAGISSKALNGAPENKYKWNKGSELQNKEFSDGSGLELYATNLRSLDPQLGRWWQIDPKPDYSQSLYSAMNNNPILYNDPLGDTARIQFKTGFLGLGKKQEVVYNNGNLTNKDGSAYGGKVKGYLGKVVNALQSLSNTAEGKSIVNELQNSTNNFTIKNGSANSFTPSNLTASYGNIPSLQNVSNGTLPTGGSGGTIVWNPGISTSGMNTAGNTNRPAYIGLGHEMAHGRDANQGTLYIGGDYTNPLNGNSYLSKDQGLNKSEWRAVYYENIIRQQAGLPLRTQYGLQDNGGSFTGTGPSLLTPAGLPINFPIQ